MKKYSLYQRKFLLFIISICFYKEKRFFFSTKKKVKNIAINFANFFFDHNMDLKTIVDDTLCNCIPNISWNTLQIFFQKIIKYFEIDNTFIKNLSHKNKLVKNIDNEINTTIGYLKLHAQITDDIKKIFTNKSNEIIIILNFIFNKIR
jgi:hypothetical protein